MKVEGGTFRSGRQEKSVISVVTSASEAGSVRQISEMEGLNKLLATSESLATQIGDNGGVVKNLRRGVGVFHMRC